MGNRQINEECENRSFIIKSDYHLPSAEANWRAINWRSRLSLIYSISREKNLFNRGESSNRWLSLKKQYELLVGE